jgi:hypothetical protein
MNLRKILPILIALYLIISVWMIGTPYIENAIFENDLDNIARILSLDGTVQSARSQVLEAVRTHEIPAKEENFIIIRDEQTRQVVVGVNYSVSVTTPFGLYTHVWKFSPRVEMGLQRVPRPAQ